MELLRREQLNALIQQAAGPCISLYLPTARGGEETRQGPIRLKNLLKKGYIRARVDGELKDIEEGMSLDRYFEHTIEVVIDRVRVKPSERGRISEAVDTSLNMAEGVVVISKSDGDITLSEQFACVDCGISLPEMEPRIFSWNTPQGACPQCTGMGTIREFHAERFVEDPELTIREGALKGYQWKLKRSRLKK